MDTDTKECIRLIEACLKHLEGQPHNKHVIKLLKQLEKKLHVCNDAIRRE